MYGAGTSPSTDEMLMMRPRPWERMCGRTAFVMRMRPKKLMSKTRWSWATELSSAAPAAPVPALLIRTSSRPNRSITCRTSVLTDSSLVTSRSWNVTPSRSVRPDACRLVPTTSKPASTNARAAACPMPEDAPVTSATGRVVVIMASSIGLRASYDTLAVGGGQVVSWRAEECVARYGSEHKQATRRRILETAGRRFKRNGIDGSGIATLMADAGLTNGAFYAHFASKEDLVATAVADQLREQSANFSAQAPGRAGLEQIVRRYLSVQHRDNPDDGCPSAALLDEIGRCSDAVQRAYTDGLLVIIDDIAARLAPDDPQSARVKTLSVFAMMAGTLQLSRALADRQLADEVLEEGIRNALTLMGAEHYS